MNDFIYDSDIIVVGAGHAGCEAALASARMGCKVILFTISANNIARMSCNPAVGGIAKGHMVREIDALGGEMGRNTDKTGIQFRMLNTTKGPAVQALRVQSDMQRYQESMAIVVLVEKNITVIEALAESLLWKANKIIGVETEKGEKYYSKKVIVTTGTFLRGLIHIGLNRFVGGRGGERASEGLSDSLRKIGFEVGRLKTGTPPRLNAKTIDFSELLAQHGDLPPPLFSHYTKREVLRQVPCYLTYTSEETASIIKKNIDRSPLYSGVIKGIGPRYCPSIEDKIVRFPERERHQIFLEPVGLDSLEYYPNGISTSLPLDVQVKLVRSIKGLEETEILKPGYAIEYDFVPPTNLYPTLETKMVEGLYHAGQINGTSGYEEAAAQGLIAGINAASAVKGLEPLILKRSESYIGVLIDDLVTKGTDEPYRMFTSRAEYRLLLRHDNADARLMERGYRLGLIPDSTYNLLKQKEKFIKSGVALISEIRIKPDNPMIKEGVKVESDTTLSQYLKRPEVNYQDIKSMLPPDFLHNVVTEVIWDESERAIETEIKYEGYIKKELKRLLRVNLLEEKKVPINFDYEQIKGLSREVREKLMTLRPISIGQAGRIPGITPAAISILIIALESSTRKKDKDCGENGSGFKRDF